MNHIKLMTENNEIRNLRHKIKHLVKHDDEIDLKVKRDLIA
jgi:hypothetical protein